MRMSKSYRYRYTVISGIVISYLCLALGNLSIADDTLGHWGVWVDPDEDCTTVEEADQLKMFVKGPNHDLCVDQHRTNAPRVTQMMAGDFIAEVLVTGEFQPVQPGVSDRVAYHGAGLYLAKDDRNYVRMERAEFVRNDGKRICYLNFEQWRKGVRTSLGLPGVLTLQEDEPVHLRIERHGKEFSFAIKYIKKPWGYLTTQEFDWDDECTIGLIGCNTSKQPFEPVFGDYRILVQKPFGK